MILTLSTTSAPESVQVGNQPVGLARPVLNQGTFGEARPGDAFPKFPMAELRLRQEGRVEPVWEGFVVNNANLIERGMAACLGLDPDGLLDAYGPQPPVTELTPVYFALPAGEGGHGLTIDVRDFPRKFPLDDGPYEIMLVVEYLEGEEVVDALGQQAAQRIYAAALSSGDQHYAVPAAWLEPVAPTEILR